MIRREPTSDGSAATEWVLISQIDHARLAGRLAAAWGAGGFAPLVPHDELLWAVEHHDDGWLTWETAPDVDPERGQPRSFTEMKIDDSLAIWTGSINGAASAGPLEGYVVAGHFCALARRIGNWRADDPRRPAVDAFLTRNERLMDQWLAEWKSRNPAANTLEVARQALAHLQFFDLLSLWFCCQVVEEPELAQPPLGPDLSLIPVDPTHVRLTPWPLVVPRLNLEIPARVVPARPYRSREDLARARSQAILLCWELQPDHAARPKD